LIDFTGRYYEFVFVYACGVGGGEAIIDSGKVFISIIIINVFELIHRHFNGF
jgi:hypothetical protein